MAMDSLMVVCDNRSPADWSVAMPFPTALSSSEVDYLATMQFATDCYLLVWQQNVVFKALINQSTFATSFASITFDTVKKGAYTDALEGYTVWLSATDDIRAAEWWGRLRADASATALSVEWNSFVPTDDYFIFVTKDIRESTKTPFLSGSTWLTDFAISYHAPPPIIYNIPTFFFALIDADGNADIAITPSAYAIADGATISSWALTTTDGGTQVSFDGGTGATVIRFTVAGNYMPRLTVTDSAGTTQWFAPYVVIEDSNLSSVVNLNFEDISIGADVQTGWNMTMPFWDGVQNILDGTMCAVYMPHNTSGNKVLFCGRSRTEDSDYTADGSGTVSFNVDGLASIMNNLNIISWRYKDVSAPDDFTEITNATPWRVIGTYIREMTNINNTHSLQFGDVTDDYVYISYFFQKGTLLDSLRDQLWSINMDFDFTSDGMFKLVRNLRYQTEAERAALVNVANFEFKHYSGDNADDIMYSLERDHSYQVGKAITGNGWYNTTAKTVTFFAALTPPVHPARGTEVTVTDRQILKADLARGAAETEGSRRARNDFAAKQSLDTLNDIKLPGGFVGKINPSVSDWYSNAITASNGIRLLTYTASDRWLLTGLSLNYDVELGQVTLDPIFQLESDDLGFAINIRNPLPTTFFDNPVMIPQAAFPTFAHDPSIDFPSGASDGDEQPVTQEDTNPLDAAQDPATMVTLNSSTLLVWSETQLSMTRTFGPTGMTWIDVTPPGLPAGHKIQQFAWDRFSDSGEGGYVIAHNEDINDPDTRVYYNKGVGTLAYWQETTITDMLATQVAPTGAGDVIIYGKFQTSAPAGGYPVTLLSGGGRDLTGDGNPDLLPSDEPGTHFAPVISARGFYDADNDKYLGQDDGNDRPVCDIELATPPGLTMSAIQMTVEQITVSSASAPEKWKSIGLDGVHLVQSDFGLTQTLPVNVPAGLFPLTGDLLTFHASWWLKKSFGNRCNIVGIRIDGTALADFAGTRYSTDNGDNFGGAQSVGLMSLDSGSLGTGFGGWTFVARDEQVRAAAIPGTSYLFDADQGDTAGQYAKALQKFAKEDYLLAPDGGAIGLYKIVNNVRSNISPDIGGAGIVVGRGGLTLSKKDTSFIWALMSFAGSVSLAYSVDLGENWNYNAAPTNNAIWIDANPRSTKQVYIADSASVWRADDGGATLTEYASPLAGLKGLAVL